MTKIVIILNKAYPSAILSWEPTTKIIIKEEILHCIADFFPFDSYEYWLDKPEIIQCKHREGSNLVGYSHANIIFIASQMYT